MRNGSVSLVEAAVAHVGRRAPPPDPDRLASVAEIAQVALARRLLAIIYGAPTPPLADWLRSGAAGSGP